MTDEEGPIGFTPADLIDAIGNEYPVHAVFTSYTFSPAAFQQYYMRPLTDLGCPDVAVLVDPIGYRQSLFAAASAEWIGTHYRLRQVGVTGAYHAKLAIVRTTQRAIIGIGSGNLTSSGLRTNAEVGTLHVLESAQQLKLIDDLCRKLLGTSEPSPFEGPSLPIILDESSRLITSLDAAIVEQIDWPNDVLRIEVVSPFVDQDLEALGFLKEMYPAAATTIRIDPRYGMLTDQTLVRLKEKASVMVPEVGDEKTVPSVHGKLICLIGETESVVLLGSANLSEPALLNSSNFEAMVEKRMPTGEAVRLLTPPGIRWTPALPSHVRVVSVESAGSPVYSLNAVLNGDELILNWDSDLGTGGSVTVISRGRILCTAVVNGVRQENVIQYRHKIEDFDVDRFSQACVVELNLDCGAMCRCWLENLAQLSTSPSLKQQFARVQNVCADPVNATQKDVLDLLKFIRKGLFSGPMARQKLGSGGDRTSDDEDVTIERSSLNRPDTDSFESEQYIRLLNRSLESAIGELRFFGQHSDEESASIGGSSDGDSEQVSPTGRIPQAETVLRRLFKDWTDALSAVESPREAVHLIRHGPVCLNTLLFCLQRGMIRSGEDLLRRYFWKPIVCVFAPGRLSSLSQAGVIKRFGVEAFPSSDQTEFAKGIMQLKVALLTIFASRGKDTHYSAGMMKDMFNVMMECPSSACKEQDTATAFWQLTFSDNTECPEITVVQSELQAVKGELETVHLRRAALLHLIESFNSGHGANREELALAATDSEDNAKKLIETLESCGGKIVAVEVSEDDEGACPSCYTVMPTASQQLLHSPLSFYRCTCGRLLIKKLEN
ncbi:MAG: hypothetical protein KDA89_18010 [Planctomycetaceae bacterium]|nr:hypothetical protein [Planctomycetaceae bacterium]